MTGRVLLRPISTKARCDLGQFWLAPLTIQNVKIGFRSLGFRSLGFRSLGFGCSGFRSLGFRSLGVQVFGV